MKSDLIKAVFSDELDRTSRLIDRYENEIKSLPKGSIFKRKIGNQEYYYLNYRDGKKVISKFLGKCSEYNINELVELLNKRKEYVSLVKKLKNDKKELLKELKKIS